MAFKIVKGYNPPKPLIENVEPQSDLNKKYTFNNAILTGYGEPLVQLLAQLYI